MCSCDFEQPTLFRSVRRKTRSDRKCRECSQIIKAGELYQSNSSLQDGAFYNWHHCANCEAKILELNNQECFCGYPVGELLEYYEDFISDTAA
jgi:hypothetical protein